MDDDRGDERDIVRVAPDRKLRPEDRDKRAVPAVPLTRVNQRHYLSRFHPSAKARDKTTYIPPEMEAVVELDRLAINRGEAVWAQGDASWTIDGRVYRDEGTGTFYPIAGEGLYFAPRTVNVILNYLAQSGGETPRAMFLISKMGGVEQHEIDYAIWLWRKRVPRG
ncbi:MAG: hypothetical protein ACTHMX_13890 [Thermomicrobiales bacterium]